MSTTSHVNHQDSDGQISPEQYKKLLAELEAKERDQQNLIKEEERLSNAILDDQEDMYEAKEWLKDHKVEWYNPATWGYGHLRKAVQHRLDEDKTELATLKSELKTVQTKLDAELDAEFAGPINFLNLKVQKLFDQLATNNGKISQKLLEDVMATMTEVMAVVQMILAQVDQRKGEQESQISKLTAQHYKEQVKRANANIREYDDMLHQAKKMKIIGFVIKIVLCVAAIALAVVTGGTASVLVAVVISALVLSGATDKLTSEIEKSLEKDGASSTLSKILSDVIVTAIMIVATLGVGAGAALAEGAMTEAVSKSMSSVLEDVTENAVSDAVEKAMTTVSEETSEAASTAASRAAKTVATDVATATAKAAIRKSVRTVLRQTLMSTIKQSATAAGRATLRQSIKSAVEEAVNSAVENAQEEINTAANDAISNVERELEQDVIEQTTQETAKRAVLSSEEEGSNSLSSVKWGRAFANGLGVGVLGTNMIQDLIGLFAGKEAKKKKWYKDLMAILQVIETLVALVIMGKFGGDMFESGEGQEIGNTSSRWMDRFQKMATGTMVLAGVAEGGLDIARGNLSEKKANVTENLGDAKQQLITLKYLLDEINQLIQSEQKHQSAEMRDEVDSTRQTDNALNQGIQGYANVLASTAV